MKKPPHVKLFCLVGVLLIGASAGAQEAPLCPIDTSGRVADVNYDGSKITWRPLVEHERLVLTVTTPCSTEIIEFDRGEDPTFDVRDVAGDIDGRYFWELQVVPVVDPGVRKLLNTARSRDDFKTPLALQQAGKLPSGPLVDSASFFVDRGVIVDSTVPEEGAEKASAASLTSAAGGPGRAAASLVADGSGLRSGSDLRVGAADQVIPDDLIVQGSACIGFDCVNGEAFSFDTIRLKENNLRIKFDDTSSTGSFPRNDWQLTANDSANGGASKFSIDDITNSRTPFTVEANAPSHSLFVDDGGRVGLGTSTPVAELHIIDGNTPTIRLQQDGSGGFTPQTWDVAGNEANFFVRDATGGSTLPLRIRPGAPSSSVDISADGDVGVGTASPAGPLHVRRSSSSFVAALTLENAGTGNVGFRLDNDETVVDINLIDQEFRINFGASPSELTLDASGNLTITGSYAPDYVFDEEYPLLSVDELAKFIEENGHLPNVVSDAEVKASGRINISQFQLSLLEKVEELTLYTIDQHRTIGALGADFVALKHENELLREKLEYFEKILLGDPSGAE
jgi:hypothetical protein